MLYRRVNSAFIVANDLNEVVKVIRPSSNVTLILILILRLKYINSTLKSDFELDTMSKPKLVVGLDDLLFLLV
jgi:hypothetical protein